MMLLYIGSFPVCKYFVVLSVLPSAAKYYANTLQTSAKRVYSQFAECS